MKKSLETSEQILIFSFLSILASLIYIAYFQSSRAEVALAELPFKSHEPVAVTFLGAVSKPGTYQIIPGTPVRKALRKARPKRNANLSEIPLNQRVEGPLVLTVEEKKEIQISIQGAVKEPIEMTLPFQTRLCDLKGKLPLIEADMNFFKSRRKLKDGEILTIPKKTVEQNCAPSL